MKILFRFFYCIGSMKVFGSIYWKFNDRDSDIDSYRLVWLFLIFISN